MASLNTLRTKFGVVLSAIIAFALLAFIFSLKSEMGFSQNDPKVGEIDSEDVTYSEYMAEYQLVKQQSGATESTEQEAAQLAAATWQAMISKKLLIPGFEKLGLAYSDAERMAVINGEIPTQTFGAYFSDRATGVYNVAAVSDFLAQAAVSAEADAMWGELNSQARAERSAVKFNALVKAGNFVNKLEVAQGVAAANNSYSGKWVSKPYSAFADSLYTVSNSEIKKYYEANKERFTKQPMRSMSYVTFAFEPTEQDIIDIENKALSTSKEFERVADLKQYVRDNLNGSISKNYMSLAQLSDDEAEALTAGKMYGPVNNNNVWTMSRVVSKLNAPDSLGLRHIVLRYDQEALADSLMTALKGGADFAQAARDNSLYSQTAQAGGEVGVLPFSSFNDEFIPALASAKRGDLVKVVSGQMIQLIEVYRADRPKAHYQVATVEYPVEASQATIGALHSAAGMFSTSATGNIEKFNGAADASEVVVRTASISNGERTVRAITDSREIARWAFGAEVGDISQIFNTEGGYVVAMLTSVDDNDYRSLESVSSSIRSTLLSEKKFADAAAALAGSTIEEVATSAGSEVNDFSDIKFSSYTIPGIGYSDSKVIGAITLGAEGLTAPIQGRTAAYVFQIDPAAVSTDQTEDMERVRAQAAVEDRMTRSAFYAIQEMANIEDLRGAYF